MGLTIERTRRHLSSRFISDVIPKSGFPPLVFDLQPFHLPFSQLSFIFHARSVSKAFPFFFSSFLHSTLFNVTNHSTS